MLSVILSVNDIDASVKFYVEALGFAHDWSMQDDDGATITREIEDRDWDERAFAVKNPDGYPARRR